MRRLTLLFITGLALVTVVSHGGAGWMVEGGQPNASNPCVGTVADQSAEETIVSIQGTRLTPDGYVKKPALLLSFGPDGSVEWARNASAHGRWWAYDVDRTPDGDLLFATTEPGISVVGELDPDTVEYEWLERFDGEPDDETSPLVTDAHDADLLSEHELVLADKGEGHERLLVYNLTRGTVQWEWRFDEHPEHFPQDGGGPADDWTHVNDVELVNVSESDAVDAGGEWFMTSVRNFDQVVFVDRATGDVELTLGEDGDHDVLHRQHNPDHLWGPNGEHTVLVADSLNDRAVEYEYDAESDDWERVWQVTGLDEPRDADRLRNGNTLITDRKGHRVVEVTPEGEAVWEVYTPFEPYDAERGAPGSEGPTMREHGVEGRFEVHDDAGAPTDDLETCAGALYTFASPSNGDATWPPEEGTSPVGRDDGVDLGPIDRLDVADVPIVPVVALVGLIVAVAVDYRRRG